RSETVPGCGGARRAARPSRGPLGQLVQPGTVRNTHRPAVGARDRSPEPATPVRRGRDVPPDGLVRVARQPDPRGADPLGRTSLAGRSGEAVGSLRDRLRDAPVHAGVAPPRHHVPLPRSEPQRLGQPRGDSRGGRRRRPPATGRPRTAPFLISLAPLGWGTTPPYPPRVGVLAGCAGSRESKHRGGRRIVSSPTSHPPPTTRDSLAPLGLGDDPPYPPRVGVLAGCAGTRESKHRGGRRIVSGLDPPAHHLPLATPSLRSGWGTTPIPPEGRRTRAVTGSRDSENQDRSRIASGPYLPPTTHHPPLATRSFRLPTSAFRL